MQRMTSKIGLIATALFFTACSQSVAQNAAAPECQHDKSTFRCVKYLKNYDADTVTFNIPGVHPLLGEKISVRVNGIDAPEVRGKGPCEKDTARIARNLIEAELKRAKRIDLVNVDRDKYFRILADVMVDGANLSEKLLRNGLAYRYDGGTKKSVDWCAAVRNSKNRTPASLGN